ncbi:MAG: LamG-like jellyroll fold domain-containing protein [Peptococcia bacterium]|jgi:hypothetical protein
MGKEKRKILFLVVFSLFVSLIFTSLVYATAGPIGLWKLDGNGLDSSGNGNDGSVSDVTWVQEGKNGTAGTSASFRGTRSCVVIPHNSIFNVDALTIETWINTGSSYTFMPAGRVVLFKGRAGYDGHPNVIPGDYDFRVVNNSLGYIDQIVFNSIFGNLSVKVDYKKNTWHHIAVTVTKEGLITLYSDGKAIATKQGKSGVCKNSEPIAIGNLIGVNDWYCHTMDGLIDEVALYNRALSAEEIKQNYQKSVFLENIKITNRENEETAVSYILDKHLSKMEFDLKKAVNELVLELDLPSIIKIASIENIYKDGVKIEHEAIVDDHKIVIEQALTAGHYKIEFTFGIEGELMIKTKSYQNEENKFEVAHESGEFKFKFINLESLPVNFLDFSNEAKNSSLEYNGSAQIEDNVLQLTPCLEGKVGSAFTKEKIALGKERSFSTYFTFRISGEADGLCFVLQESSSEALGAAGSGLGVRNIPSPVVAVEFDTWAEAEKYDSPHVGIDINPQGEGRLLALESVTAESIPWEIGNGEVYHVWIDYNGISKYLDVRMGTSNNRALSNLLLHHQIDLASIISQDVYMGFTAATGMAYAKHEILSWLVAGGN